MYLLYIIICNENSELVITLEIKCRKFANRVKLCCTHNNYIISLTKNDRGLGLISLPHSKKEGMCA